MTQDINKAIKDINKLVSSHKLLDEIEEEYENYMKKYFNSIEQRS